MTLIPPELATRLADWSDKRAHTEWYVRGCEVWTKYRDGEGSARVCTCVWKEEAQMIADLYNAARRGTWPEGVPSSRRINDGT